jgi:SAM-dependent methyltransferase
VFFIDKVKSIKPGDRVLEIGPGGTPHPRADEFLDLDPSLFKDADEAAHQRGLAAPLKTSKKIHYYNGKKFPFKDKEFDYVICSHVLEHVDNPDKFLSELFRIGKRGYIEYPTILYDYIYDIPVHPNFVYYNKKTNKLSWMKKKDTNFHDFRDVQAFFFESSVKGHDSLILSLVNTMMQGFEWSHSFASSRTENIADLVPPISRIPKSQTKTNPVQAIDTGLELGTIPLHAIRMELKIRTLRRGKRIAQKVVPLSIRKSIHRNITSKIK